MGPVIRWLQLRPFTPGAPWPARRAPLDLLCATLTDVVGLRERARDLGVTQRQGKIDVCALLVTVLLGLAVRGPTAIAQLGHLLAEVTGVRLARSSVWDRFTPPFRDLVQHALDEEVRRARGREVRPPGVLAGFKDVIAVDATVVKVDDRLQGVWKGTRQNTTQAALKVHAWVRAFTRELLKYGVTADAHGDGTAFGVDHQLRGCLVLVDKGYSSPSLWRRIQNVGGSFLTRLPKDRDPEIVRELRRHRGRARKLAGRSLRAALQGAQRHIVDVAALFRCRVREYRTTTNRWTEEPFRVVAVRQHDGTYEGFVTNAPPDLVPAVPRTRRLRWEVETSFKTARSGSGLPELPSTKQHIVETLVYASLLRATTSMQALAAFRAETAAALGVVIHPGQWQWWWNRQLLMLLDRVVDAARQLSRRDIALMLADPDVGRLRNRETILLAGYAC